MFTLYVTILTCFGENDPRIYIYEGKRKDDEEKGGGGEIKDKQGWLLAFWNKTPTHTRLKRTLILFVMGQ